MTYIQKMGEIWNGNMVHWDCHTQKVQKNEKYFKNSEMLVDGMVCCCCFIFDEILQTAHPIAKAKAGAPRGAITVHDGAFPVEWLPQGPSPEVYFAPRPPGCPPPSLGPLCHVDRWLGGQP